MHWQTVTYAATQAFGSRSLSLRLLGLRNAWRSHLDTRQEASAAWGKAAQLHSCTAAKKAMSQAIRALEATEPLASL